MEKRKRNANDQGETEEDFKDHFPAIFREIKEGKEGLIEQEMRTTAGSKKVRKFQGYVPGVVDYICRCKTEEEAIEIINYLLEKGDITEDYAEKLKIQLKEKGLVFFGEHRSPGYYERA